MQPGVTKPFFIFVHRFLGKFPKRIESPFDRDTPQISCCKTRRRPRARNSNTPPAMRFSAVISPIPVRSGTNPSLTQSCPARMKKQVMRHTYRRTRLPYRTEGRYRPDGKAASGQRTTRARSPADPSQQEPRSKNSRGSIMFDSIDGSFLSLRPAYAVRRRKARPAITYARSASGPKSTDRRRARAVRRLLPS